MARRLTAIAATTVILSAALTSCTAPQPQTLCSDGATSVTIYNYYADHQAADVQTISLAPDDCSILFRVHPVPKTFDPELLNQRSVTVFVFKGTSDRTVWVHRLPGGGAALLDDAGGSWQSKPTIAHYYAPDADVVDRSEVPTR